MHEGTHREPRANGDDGLHDEHASAPTAVHVAQEEWHGTHALAVEFPGTEHVKPGSTESQPTEQPSPDSWLPSSHTSLPADMTPSPQIVAQVDFEARPPPVQE